MPPLTGAPYAPHPSRELSDLWGEDNGYCLLHSTDYVVEITGDGVINLVRGSIMNHIDPRLRIPTHGAPTHPGEMLNEEFLKPLEMTQTELAKRIDVS
jgi:hypothetical protein